MGRASAGFASAMQPMMTPMCEPVHEEGTMPEPNLKAESAERRAEYWKAEHIAANVRIAELEANYNELILAVASTFPNETRHQTALRYILRAEDHRQLEGSPQDSRRRCP